jgi:F0F1-type ATP synthase assembly protein I
MSQTGNQSNPDQAQPKANITLAVVAGQVGCLTLVIIIVALIIGLFLDRTLETLPLFTILFLVGSMPVTFVVIIYIINNAKKRLESNAMMEDSLKSDQEEADRDRE